MKKTFLTLLSCFACLQSSYTFGAIAPFGESILIMDAILSATADEQFRDLFSPTDFALRLDRKTKKVNEYGLAEYIFETCTPNTNNNCVKSNLYMVVVDVAKNPDIGGNIITVVDIKPIKAHHRHHNHNKHSCSSK